MKCTRTITAPFGELSMKIKGHTVRIAIVALLLLVPGVRAFAQAQNTGTLAGNITDSQGLAIASATITLTADDTAQVTTTASNATGEYLFTDVKVGGYLLHVSAPGFTSLDVDGILIGANQNVRQDARLDPGSVSSSVTVHADSTTIDTRSATIGTTIDQNLVEKLPIDGENIVSLAALLPGVSNVNAPTTFTSDTGGPTYSVSGARSNQNLFLLDGTIWNNAYYNTGLNYPPRLALQEASVLLNNYKAQYGRNSGSVFNVLTRSGSNVIHGTLWEYYQSNAFDAKDYISHLLPHLVSNQFGGTIGGPLKHDKVFYFLSYQDLRYAGQIVANDETPTYAEAGLLSPGVPNPCSSTGQFVGMNCANLAGDFHFTGDPLCGTSGINCVTPSTAVRNPIYMGGSNVISQLNSAWQQAGNTGTSPCVSLLQPLATTKYLATPEIPTTCFNPIAVAFLNKYIPYATQSNGGQVPVAYSIAAQPRNNQEGLARMDVNLANHVIDARVYITNANDFTSNSVSSSTDQGIANYEQTYNSAKVYAGSIGDTWVLSPNVLNVARAAYKRYNYNIVPSDPTTWQNLGSALQVPGHLSLPEIESSGRFTAGSQNSGYSYTLTSNYEFDESLSISKGKHNVQLGAQFLNVQYVHRYDEVPFIETEQKQTGDPIGDFLLGLTYSNTFGNLTNLAALQHDLYLYAQDDWRATSRLTINLGMRYEIPFSWKEEDGQGVTFNPGYQSKVFPSAPASVAYEGDPRISVRPGTRYDNWGPRVGMAYDVFGNGNTSIRSGFGIFYNALNANLVGIGQPYHYTVTYSTPAGGFSNPLSGEPAIPSAYVKGNPQFVTPFSISYADQHNVTPYVIAVNLGVQQHVGRSSILEVNYVGKFSRHDLILFDQNPAIVDCSGAYFLSNPNYCVSSSTTATATYTQRVKYPGFNYGGQGIVDYATIGSSHYHGLQAIYSVHALRNINAYTSFTWSRALDVGSEGATTSAHVPDIAAGLKSQFGPSDFNSKFIFNLGWTTKLPNGRWTTSHGSKFDKAVLGGLLNGWTFGGVYNARTGSPINVTLAGDMSGTDDRPQRPQLVSGVSPKLSSARSRTAKVNEWFNTSAFANPTFGTFGNVSRNSLVGPGYINLNTDLMKHYKLPGDGHTLEIRIDAFNLFNTPNLSNPNASLASSSSSNVNFGQITATVGTNGVVGSNGRRLQLGGVIHF